MRRLLPILWSMSRTDLRLLWFALRHRDRPGWLLPVTVVLALYAVSPLNLAIPVLGVVDDLVLLPLVLHTLVKLLPSRLFDGLVRQQVVSR